MSAESDHGVADVSLAGWGRREITIAETEKPGPMALRDAFDPMRRWAGARMSAACT